MISGVYDLNQVIDYLQHTLNLGGSLVFHRLVHFAETKCYQGVFLALGFVDRAFNQRNFYLAHCSLLVIGYWLLVIGTNADNQ